MKVRAFLLVSAAFGIVFASLPLAADELEVTGSVRARYEALSGQSRAGFKEDDQFLTERTIVDAQYAAGHWRVFGELTDSRAWLADRTSALSTNEVNALEPTQLYVAWAQSGVFGNDSAFAAQAGRFAVNLGSRRLIASDDYRNTGNSNLGLRFDAKALGWTGTALYLLPTARLPEDIDSLLDNDVRFDRESAKAVLWGGQLASPGRVVGGSVELLFLKFRERDAPTRPTRDRDLDTWNLRWFRDAAPSRWDYEFETAFQHGRARTGTSATAPLRPVDASFVHGRVGYSWSGAGKPRVALEYDWVSGDTGPDHIHRYDTLFGGRRFELAPSGLYNQVGRANLSAPGLRYESTPSTRLDLMATWKLLYLASRTDAFSTTGVRDARGLSGRFAGHQFDLRARYWLVPRKLRFELDTLWLEKARFLETAPNARPGDTRFYSLNLTWAF